MSIKIRVSYTEDKELADVMKRLHPVRGYKLQPQKGRFKRAYIELEDSFLSDDLVKENRCQPAENQ